MEKPKLMKKPKTWVNAVIMAVIVLLAYTAISYRTMREADHIPVLTEHATVIGSRRVAGVGEYDRAEYFVKFQLADGSKKEVELGSSAYYKLTQGMSGELTWQGKWFLSFENDDPAYTVTDPPSSVLGYILSLALALGVVVVVFLPQWINKYKARRCIS